jgi:hypothetical protein
VSPHHHTLIDFPSATPMLQRQSPKNQ